MIFVCFLIHQDRNAHLSVMSEELLVLLCITNYTLN